MILTYWSIWTSCSFFSKNECSNLFNMILISWFWSHRRGCHEVSSPTPYVIILTAHTPPKCLLKRCVLWLQRARKKPENDRLRAMVQVILCWVTSQTHFCQSGGGDVDSLEMPLKMREQKSAENAQITKNSSTTSCITTAADTVASVEASLRHTWSGAQRQ